MPTATTWRGEPRSERSARATGLRWGRRFVALLAYALAIFLAYQIVTTLLGNEEAQTPPPPAAEQAPPPPPPAAELPERPAAAPARIPPWAWAMHEWHLTAPADRGARPAEAPTRLPAWYWEWREWRMALADG